MASKSNLIELESALTSINELIEKMEHHDLTLEKSLAYFEKGIHLIKNCQKILRDAEQRVQILIQNSNADEAQADLKPYEANDSDNEPS